MPITSSSQARLKRCLWEYATVGTQRVFRRLEQLGWCTLKSETEIGKVAPGMADLMVALEDDGQGRMWQPSFCLMLELLAHQAPFPFVTEIVKSDDGRMWGIRLLAQVGQGRWPLWWNMDLQWHQALLAGNMQVPIMHHGLVERGSKELAFRLAEAGWLNITECTEGDLSCYAFSWEEGVAPLLDTTLLAAFPVVVGGSIQQIVGRLALMLHQKLMRAPVSTQFATLKGKLEGADLWAAVLAARAARGIHPLWWDRSRAWHAAVREHLASAWRKAAPTQRR